MRFLNEKKSLPVPYILAPCITTSFDIRLFETNFIACLTSFPYLMIELHLIKWIEAA
jgi:hypothetical protein